MRYASIDIGTNSVLLLIADADGCLVPIVDLQRIPRLGKGVDKHTTLSTESIERALAVLSEYRAIIDKCNVDRVVAAGTRALREALNAELLVSEAQRRFGFSIEILPETEEATWTFKGAISNIAEDAKEASLFLVIDIGGGSTELTIGTRREVHAALSTPLGSVRITERFFHSDPPTKQELEVAGNFIADVLRENSPRLSLQPGERHEVTAIGVAGTITTLAAMQLGLQAYESASGRPVEGAQLKYVDVENLVARLSRMKVEQIRSIPQVSEGREDVILAGGLVLLEMMRFFRLPSLLVSDRGLRYGLILRDLQHRELSL
ncbi:MAG: Ppx/GppA phosphatase family protein [Bacteroidota bacterium]